MSCPTGFWLGNTRSCEFLREQTDLAVRHHVVVVKIAATKDDEPANLLKPVRHADKFYGPLDTRNDD